MPGHPLIIDAEPGDCRVLASSLELRNRKTVNDAFAYNVRLKEEKELASRKRLADVAHEAAHDFTR